MATYAQCTESPWKLVDYGEKELRDDDSVYHAGEDFLCYYRVFFDDLGEVVQATCDRKRKEEEA